MIKRNVVMGVGLGLILAVSSATIAAQDDQKLNITEQFYGVTISFKAGDEYHNGVLSITGPNDYHASKENKMRLPTINLSRYGKLRDGRYSYHLTAASNQKMVEPSTKSLNDGRDAKAKIQGFKGVSLFGGVWIKDGKIVTHKKVEEK